MHDAFREKVYPPASIQKLSGFKFGPVYKIAIQSKRKLGKAKSWSKLRKTPSAPPDDDRLNPVEEDLGHLLFHLTPKRAPLLQIHEPRQPNDGLASKKSNRFWYAKGPRKEQQHQSKLSVVQHPWSVLSRSTTPLQILWSLNTHQEYWAGAQICIHAGWIERNTVSWWGHTSIRYEKASKDIYWLVTLHASSALVTVWANWNIRRSLVPGIVPLAWK